MDLSLKQKEPYVVNHGNNKFWVNSEVKLGVNRRVRSHKPIDLVSLSLLLYLCSHYQALRPWITPTSRTITAMTSRM